METQNTHTSNPIADTAIMALNAHPELLPSFMEEIEDYLFGKMLLGSESGETISYEEFKKIADEECK